MKLKKICMKEERKGEYCNTVRERKKRMKQKKIIVIGEGDGMRQ